MDFVIGMMVFTAVVIVFFVYASNSSSKEVDDINGLLQDVTFMTSSLISEGYPVDWDYQDVERIGITDGNYRINIDKLHNFSKIPYNESKNILGMKSDYLIFFMNKSREKYQLSSFCGKGHPDINITNISNSCIIDMGDLDYDSLVKMERYLIYKKDNNKSGIITMEAYLWT